MKVRATKASPGRILIKGPGVKKWIEPVGLDDRPGKWVDLPDGVPAVEQIVGRFRNGGQIEVQGFVTLRSPVVTQCAGDPRCPDPIASKELNMCHYHAMKLYRAEEKARTDEAVALAVAEIKKAQESAEKDNQKAAGSAEVTNKRSSKAGAKKDKTAGE